MLRYLIAIILYSPLLVAQTLHDRITKSIEHAEYILCIDGGGSKTELQIVHQGNVLLTQRTDSTNIDNVSQEAIEVALKTLLDRLSFGDEKIPLSTVVERSAVITGAAGAEEAHVQEIFNNVFRAYGFTDDSIVTTYDSEIALEFVGDNGIILIAGTGSVCRGKKNGNNLRVGGLGWRLGDEGSGYDLGLQALKATLEHEMGFGRPTQLTEAIKERFGVQELITLITPLHRGDILPSGVAALAPLVFEAADAGDVVAIELVDYAATQLALMLSGMGFSFK